MKRIITWIGLSLLLLLAACNPKPEKSATGGENQTEAAESATATSAPNINGDNEVVVTGPTVADFFATWCGPCKALSPMLESMEKKYGDKVRFVRIDVDEYPSVANHYQIEAIPTLLYMNADGLIDRTTGLLDEATLEQKIAALAG